MAGIAGVYMIQSLSKPERIYVGSSFDVKGRLNDHLFHLRRNEHHSPILQSHFNKYGKSDLSFDVIEIGEYLDKNHLLSREQMWFAKYSHKGSEIPYFNMAKIAGSTKGYKTSKRGQKRSVYQFELNGVFIRDWDSLTEASKALGIKRGRIRECANGMNLHSMGFIWRYKKNIGTPRNLTTEEIGNLNGAKKVLQFDKDGVFIKEWHSTKDVGIAFGISDTGIQACCHGRTLSIKGYFWKYKEDIGEIRNLYSSELPVDDKHIFQYNNVGIFIKEWSSVSEACRALHFDTGSICNACIGRYRMSHGFFWKYERDIKSHRNLTKTEMGIKGKTSPAAVLQFSLNGQFIAEYRTINEARGSVGFKKIKIGECCRGKVTTAGGFVWKYKEDVEQQYLMAS